MNPQTVAIKTITLVHGDGSQYLALIVDENMDTQRWAQSRAASLALLGVVRVVEEIRYSHIH